MKKFADLSVDGDSISFGVEFSKVDKKNRVVVGYATLDNLDNQDNIIDFNASRQAFAAWRKNIREMHAPKAVGKAIDFYEQDFVDPETGDIYKGIVVEAYISKGAQDTWEKVLDGTLTGFSIAGAAESKEEFYNSELDKLITRITKYRLSEVSLVDNPANPLANVLSIVKSENGQLVGSAVEIELENVLYCEDCKTALLSKDNDKVCPTCDLQLQSIGWVESTDEKVEDVKKMIESLNSKTYEQTQGGVSVAKKEESTKVDEKTLETSEELEKAETPEETPSEDEKVEKAETTDEVDETEEVVKSDSKEEEAEKPEPKQESFELSDDQLNVVATKVAELLSKSMAEEKPEKEDLAKAENTEPAEEAGESEFTKALGEIKDVLKALNSEFSEIKNSVSSLETGGAGRKSEEISKSGEKKGSIWGGKFLGVSDLD